jgi:predicted dehydrogenase
MNRRSFIKSSAAAATGLLAMSSGPLIRTVRGEEGQKEGSYTVALVGTGWWGMNILREAVMSKRCRVVAMCDVDENQLNKAITLLKTMTGDEPKRFGDYREMLEQAKPQIVINATPDHWHALVTIAAVKSGAHVYVEKPISHTVLEGKAMVKAARDTDRVVQVGTHRRVSPHNVSGMKFLKDGKAGKIGMVRCFVHYSGGAGEPTPDAETPKGLNWDMWCGPAPMRPFNPKIHPKGFRQFLDYANGQIGDWGIHWLDQVLWWSDELYPKSVHSTGGRFIKRDNTDAPDCQVATFKFDNFVATWEHRMFGGNEAEKSNIGAYFYGTNGTFHMGWLDGWTFYPWDKTKQPIHEDAKFSGPDQQNIKELFANFLESIEQKKRPVCDIEIGHRSTNLALLGMLSMKLGRSVNWDGSKDEIIGDAEASKLLRRDYRGEWKYPEA